MSLITFQEQIASITATPQNCSDTLLSTLHDIMRALGFAAPDTLAHITSAMHMFRAEVLNVNAIFVPFR